MSDPPQACHCTGLDGAVSGPEWTRWPVPGSHVDLLERPICGVLTTMGRDGQPHSSLVWVDYDGAYPRVNTTQERQKGPPGQPARRRPGEHDTVHRDPRRRRVGGRRCYRASRRTDPPVHRSCTLLRIRVSTRATVERDEGHLCDPPPAHRSRRDSRLIVSRGSRVHHLCQFLQVLRRRVPFSRLCIGPDLLRAGATAGTAS